MTNHPLQIRPATDQAVAEAAALIGAGSLVAFPTETVYGLGADATSDNAVAAVFAAKDRPDFNPLIVHFADAQAVSRTVAFDQRADALARAFWPGALTLVLPRGPDNPISLLASSGLDTLAVRVPDHPMGQALLEAAGCPIAAPSANRSGAVSPTMADHVAASLGDRVTLILDGGPCRVGIESTVIDLTAATPVLLRPGGIAADAIAAKVGPLAAPETVTGPARSPGMIGRHYAPGTPLRLDARGPRPGEALLAFGPDAPTQAPGRILNLSPAGDVVEAAANLFAMMHALDATGATAIAVMAVPETGLGCAINDRLRRAAAAPD
ncbi:MAG: L-threonylcarbamoyladenylate synthase [Rhodospirillales bacterium]|jgi:L-threonylcarbamoyladenylate synthase|nr:L-threonylcarbamoyladenylate synthase [Rhodospirillales bacterium]MDP6885144.1 L-threonylcarbamoyladenylate synthase [Rhodospirillales bacterium]